MHDLHNDDVHDLCTCTCNSVLLYIASVIMYEKISKTYHKNLFIHTFFVDTLIIK